MSDLTLSGLSERIGRELGISDWVAIDQERIEAFATCTGDHQWIHVDVERARRESPFRGPIAHGYLTLAMIAPLAMQIGVIPRDAAAGLNYGIDRVTLSCASASRGEGATACCTRRSRAQGRRTDDHEDP